MMVTPTPIQKIISFLLANEETISIRWKYWRSETKIDKVKQKHKQKISGYEFEFKAPNST